MRDHLLVAEELMLLLLDDDGASIAGAGTLHYTLTGALLVELAFLGRVELDEDTGGPISRMNGAIVRPVGDAPLDDPVLQAAFDTVVAREQRVQPLLIALNDDLLNTLLGRLQERGLIRKERRRVLGIFRTTTWPAEDERHEEELRRRIRAAIEDGEEPEPHTAAVIGLVYASGAMPALRPPLPWNSTTVSRAKQIMEGDWGSSAVNSAVVRTAAAIAASSAAAIVSVTTATT
ncbi:GPP34 family phosphoprotein [Nocardiopsis sp. MG754419]|uniref:GOLPH3/VPS74 family protein n=1 Tax=Nocardiopsis sp. MG754419 TaxID=2259865 RepID=UPI001BA51A09|nr:GPP34 family phosphoprotein [Nocardiopsis sp. MG754419]MBR8744612.1 GPP34 family phosphoprotein [Nocardiopsis sp. MG754419]